MLLIEFYCALHSIEVKKLISACVKPIIVFQITEEQLKLMKYQINFEEKFHESYKGLSLHQTMKQLLIHREFKPAEELRKEFKVPDKR